jgi:hypothetical protein
MKDESANSPRDASAECEGQTVAGQVIGGNLHVDVERQVRMQSGKLGEVEVRKLSVAGKEGRPRRFPWPHQTPCA